MTHTTLKQVRHDRWEDNNGNYIWKDDFWSIYNLCKWNNGKSRFFEESS